MTSILLYSNIPFWLRKKEEKDTNFNGQFFFINHHFTRLFVSNILKYVAIVLDEMTHFYNWFRY